MNIDDPTKGACNLGDCATNKKTIQYQITFRVMMISQARTTKPRLSIKESGKTQGVKILRCWKTLQVSRQPEQNPAGQFFKDTIKTTQR